MAAIKDKIARWVRDMAATGAELLVFPEYGSMEVATTRGLAVAGDLKGSLQAVAAVVPALEALHQELARELNVYILAASAPTALPDGRILNVARLVAPSGKIGRERKNILTPFERTWGLSVADTPKALQVYDTRLGRIGVAICYESEFPLSVRARAEAGARLLLVPSCTEALSGSTRIKVGAMARSLENTIAAVVSPTVGDAPWSPAVDRNTGRAGIYTPADVGLSLTGVLAEGELNAQAFVTADIDFARLSELKKTGEMRNSADWAEQPGVAAERVGVEVVDID